MKLLELIVLKKQDFKVYGISAKVFFQGIEDTVDLLMKENHIQFSTIIELGELSIELDLIKTVCLNLLDNACKAVGGNGRISLKGHPVEKGYQFIIEGNGCGMETNELSKIKEAFYTVDKSRSRSVDGSGLGLALCDQIVKIHHGTIRFESVLGQKMTVTIVLKGVKKCKYRMKFLLAVTLLIIIPLVPLTVSKIQNNQLIGHLQVEKIKNERLDVQTSKLSVVEKSRHFDRI